MREVALRVKGHDNYWRFTLASWLREIKWLIEEEYCVRVSIVVEDSSNQDPILLLGDEVILKGIPGEEGYLHEVIKSALESMGIEPCRPAPGTQEPSKDPGNDDG